MNISEIRVFLNKNPGSVKANGDFVVEGALKVRFTVVDAGKGLFVGLPGEYYTDTKTQEKKWSSKVSFTNDQVKEELSAQLLAAYKQQASGGGASKPATTSSGTSTPKKNVPPF